TSETEGGITVPATASGGEVIVVSMSSGFAGELVGLWIFSQPSYMGTHTVGADGTISVALPEGASGERRIAAYVADQGLIGWAQIDVRAAGGTDGDPDDGGSENDAGDSSADEVGANEETPAVSGVDSSGGLAE